MQAAIRPERLLKDLRNLWVDLGKTNPPASCALAP